jgi:hypothetical protein
MSDAEVRPYVGDIGTIIELDCQEVITGASNLKMYCSKPKLLDPNSYELKEWTTGVSVYGTTKIRYTVVSGDFNVAGRYLVQAYLELGTWKGRTDIVEFYVHDKLV